MEGIIDDLPEAYKAKVEIKKVSIDTDMDIANKYGVQSIPALVMVRNEEKIGELLGLVTKGKVERFIDEATGATSGNGGTDV